MGHGHNVTEEYRAGNGDSGICDEIVEPQVWTTNDRIIYRWQTYAQRYAVKTIDRHLADIRYFENVLLGKRFSFITVNDVAKFREELKRRADAGAVDALAPASIKHTVSHLVAFLKWLKKQNGFKRLPQDLEGYLQLPRGITAAALQAKQKNYPTLEEAEKLLLQMPSSSFRDRRAQAMFAISFLGCLRAATVASLRMEHFDVTNRLILQDGKVSRTKAGKSVAISWFPIQSTFETCVVAWVESLCHLGFKDDDALFPNEKWLKHRTGKFGRSPVPVMATEFAVTQAFAIACENSQRKYTPHAVKHTIGAERDARPLTQIQRKAWSENMGHENEQTTERHYGKLSDERRIEVLENIGEGSNGGPIEMTDQEKIALVDEIRLYLLGQDPR